MRRVDNPLPCVRVRRIGQGLILAILGLVAPAGCTREFFREWANLDVSQAVFEKSRDPRFRVDVFSVDPPGLSRFADPYDPDVPPAPPDDPVAEAISPVPQWPNHRLMMPVEGTGYLDLMDKWKREREARDAEQGKDSDQTRDTSAKPDQAAPGPMAPPSNLELPPAGSPFVPGAVPPVPGAGAPVNGATPAAPTAPSEPRVGRSIPAPYTSQVAAVSAAKDRGVASRNSGTTGPKSTQVKDMGKSAAKIPPPNPPAMALAAKGVKVARPTRDASAVRTSLQPTSPTSTDPQRGLPPEPIIGLDPNPEEKDMADPRLRRPDQIKIPPGGQFTQDQVQELAGLLVPFVPELTDIEAYGYPKDIQPYVLSMQQAFTLALINSRTYQNQLETLYAAALTVTLQRFNFQPQFYAGMAPRTSPLGAGFPGFNPPNSFTYNTLEAPGGQVSTLQLGTVAGYGKLLNTGGQLLMGFANQLVFNFVGSNPIQPTVQSSLPIAFVQPFLRGAGRAVVLEGLTQAERNLLYQVRSFAKFRQEFTVATLVSGSFESFGTNVTTSGFSGGGNNDPAVGFIPTLTTLQIVDLDRRNVAAFEQLVALYVELIRGEASGLSQLQVDQVQSNLQNARQTLVNDKLSYRTTLDRFKVQLGLPPDTPIVLDRALLRPFQKVFAAVEDWQKDKDRNLDDLPKIAANLPPLEDVIIDGRSALGIYKNYSGDQAKFERDNEEGLEEILRAAVRVAFEYRLDMMNNRAALYDRWRQLAVTANALRGYLNVSLTNQILTPPNTTNPFAFLDQAKQFSLVFNAELPLVRVAERNNFRLSLINYQAARRTLMYNEDFLKTQLRTDVRNLQQNYVQYEIARRNFVLQIRLKDQAFEAIIAPPQGGASGGVGQTANAATQTTNLINFQQSLINIEKTLINEWQQYESSRLVLYRDLGTLPYDEWEAFSELFPAQYSGPALGPPTLDAGPATFATSTTSAP